MEEPRSADQPPAETPASTYQTRTETPEPSLRPQSDVPRSTSAPPPGSRKSVQFVDNVLSEAQAAEASGTAEEGQNQRHRGGESSRGYEAGDDTDSAPDEYRRRQQGQHPSSSSAPGQNIPPMDSNGDPSSSRRRQHRRRQSYEPPSSTSKAKEREQEQDRDRRRPGRQNSSSPDSDVTIDLPERFDKHGKKKPEPGDDVLADAFQDILTGKGPAGKLFGNFAEGLFGSEKRRK